MAPKPVTMNVNLSLHRVDPGLLLPMVRDLCLPPHALRDIRATPARCSLPLPRSLVLPRLRDDQPMVLALMAQNQNVKSQFLNRAFIKSQKRKDTLLKSR